jgi:hypothetical protein
MDGAEWFWRLVDIGAGVCLSLFLSGLGLRFFFGVLAEGIRELREAGKK